VNIFKFIKNKISGFSLMETMIASAILMIMALAFSTMMSDFSKQQRSVAVSGEANELFNLIGVALQNQLMCSSSFVGQPIDVTNSGYQALVHVTQAGTGSTVASPIPGTVIAAPGLVSGNLKVVGASFTITGTISPSDYLAEVAITIQKKIGGSSGPVGGSLTLRKFPVTLNVDTVAKIVKNCQVGSGASGAATVPVYRISAKGCGGDPVEGPLTTAPNCVTPAEKCGVVCGKFGCSSGFSGALNCTGTCVKGLSPQTCANTYFGKIAP